MNNLYCCWELFPSCVHYYTIAISFLEQLCHNSFHSLLRQSKQLVVEGLDGFTRLQILWFRDYNSFSCDCFVFTIYCGILRTEIRVAININKIHINPYRDILYLQNVLRDLLVLVEACGTQKGIWESLHDMCLLLIRYELVLIQTFIDNMSLWIQIENRGMIWPWFKNYWNCEKTGGRTFRSRFYHLVRRRIRTSSIMFVSVESNRLVLTTFC